MKTARQHPNANNLNTRCHILKSGFMERESAGMGAGGAITWKQVNGHMEIYSSNIHKTHTWPLKQLGGQIWFWFDLSYLLPLCKIPLARKQVWTLLSLRKEWGFYANFLWSLKFQASPQRRKQSTGCPQNHSEGALTVCHFATLVSQTPHKYPPRVPVEWLTSGSCNDRSVMLCECCSQGGGLRRGGAAETRLLRLLQCGWRWHSWQEVLIGKYGLIHGTTACAT